MYNNDHRDLHPLPRHRQRLPSRPRLDAHANTVHPLLGSSPPLASRQLSLGVGVPHTLRSRRGCAFRAGFQSPCATHVGSHCTHASSTHGLPLTYPLTPDLTYKRLCGCPGYPIMPGDVACTTCTYFFSLLLPSSRYHHLMLTSKLNKFIATKRTTAGPYSAKKSRRGYFK